LEIWEKNDNINIHPKILQKISYIGYSGGY